MSEQRVRMLYQRIIDMHLRQSYERMGGSEIGFDAFAQSMRDRLSYDENSDTVGAIGAESLDALVDQARQSGEFENYFKPAPEPEPQGLSAWEKLNRARAQQP